ncbi:MAG TPA: PxKF domain-containing protein [Pyrinomonadaceae bacterium]|nr:PxKF domain-containing protein [Pyrinomonadaceae bacterium]
MRVPSRTARAALLILFIAAVSAAAALPGSRAATEKGTPAARMAAPHKTLSPGAPAALAPATLPTAVRSLIPTLLQLAPPAIETFDADCTTPKAVWTLGNVVCVKVNAPSSPDRTLRRLQLINPAGLAVGSADVTSTIQTVSFTLPSAATSTFPSLMPGGSSITLDNRGTWRVNLVDTSDASVSDSVSITVRDATATVADLQISKFLTGSTQAAAGTNIKSVIWVFNAGPDSATNARFTDVPPANTTFQSLTQTSGPTFNCTTPAVDTAGTSQCAIATLANGETAGFIATYKVNSGVADSVELVNSASVTSDTTETAATNNSTDENLTASNPTPPACTISCPSNITVAAAQGQTGAAVTYDAPAAVGSCGSGPVTLEPASGSFFPIGSSVVTATAPSGDHCSFIVTVEAANDAVPPAISCPSDITVTESSAAANSAVVNYTVAATDDSGAVTVDCNPPSGATFPAGVTQVNCTATDPSGNSASCSFDVTVNQIGCNLDANSAAPVPNVASLPAITRACSVTLLPADDPTAKDACGGTISGETASDRSYEAPGTYTVVWTYTDSAGNTTAQNQTVTILPDSSAPVPDAPSLPTVTGECSAAITGEAPTATDNCGGSGLVGVALDPLSYNTAGTHVVRWQFTDAAGNSTIQNQNVVVTDTHAPVVSLNGPSSVTVECHTSYADQGATVADNCSATPTLTSTSNVNVDVPGTYQVIWTATDAGGNTHSATRTVNVVDTIKPVITMNGPASLDVILGSVYTDAGATAADSCAGSVPVSATSTVNTAAIGTYTVTYTATDPSGNAAVPVVRTVRVIYNFTGFFSPVGNVPTINQANAGRSIPVKFSLAGNHGLGIMAAGSPFSQQVTCGSDNVADLQETGTAGSSSLSYDPGSNQYHYVWKTEGSWAGTCRVLTVRLIDGTDHVAYFKFK